MWSLKSTGVEMANRVLFSNINMCNFGGSELVTLELAEYYMKKNWDVTIYSPTFGSPLLDHISPGIKTTQFIPSDLDEYNIVWSHHGLLLNKINAKNKRKHQTIVSNHMSSWVSIEYPQYDPGLVDLILANSEETKYKFDNEHKIKCHLFQNPSPPIGRFTIEKPFSVFDVGTYKKKKVAAISNHRPLDLEAVLNTHVRYFNVYKYGSKDFIQRITPKFLKEKDFDFVVCNGKSVQHAMRAEKPVFLYDNFGGCGWLTSENFERAAWYNFSGRGLDRCDLNSILDHSNIKPISDELFDWRFKLDLWLEKKNMI